MASLTKTVGKRGATWRIEFFDANRERRCIRLGKVDKRQAESTKARVELLVAAKITGTAPDLDTSRWVAGRDDTLYAKLAHHKLVAQRGKTVTSTLAAFLDTYIEGRSDIKPNTRAHLKRARNNLVSFFGSDKPLDGISPGDADEYRLELQETMADNTVRRICGRAKQFFRAALRKRLIAESSFADMKGTSVQANRSRDFFVSHEVAKAVLDACPDNQWRLLFALSRYGGLRCPSEHLALRWGDIDWGVGRITVRSPKTEHHKGKESRVIPLFGDLRPYLEAVWNEAEESIDPKAERISELPVITRYRDTNANLRTQLLRIIRRAGLEPWPKLFQNLRATRATELVGWGTPSYVAAGWLGHSNRIADEHYRQTTDEHFAKAIQIAQHTAQQSASESGGNDRNAKERQCENYEDSATLREMRYIKAPPVGLEPCAESSRKTGGLVVSGALRGAVDVIDPALEELLCLLPTLSADERIVILTNALAVARAIAGRRGTP